MWVRAQIFGVCDMSMMENTDELADVAKGGLQHIRNPEAASELDNFVYIVSHDLRSSARALTEVPKWLRDDLSEQGVTLNADAKENFELLERHAKRLDRMLLDLLVFSRVGRMQEVSEFDLGDLVDRVIADSAAPQRLQIDVLGELPRFTMGYKDAYVLVKCILDNVITHGPEADARLVIRGQRKRDTVTLTFTDNGPGIPETDVARAFRPMTTLRRRDEVEGSGMGLAIIHRIVLFYRGEMWAGAGPDGNGFRLRLRLREAVRGTDQERGAE